MAKRQLQGTTTVGRRRRRQQILLKYSTVCVMVVVMLLARLDSGIGGGGGLGVVDALSISLSGNGNRLQQQQQQQLQLQHQPQDDNDPQLQTQHQLQQHVDTGEAEEVHNYVVEKATTELVPNVKDLIFNGNGIGKDLTRSQLIISQPLKSLKMFKRAPGGFVGMRGKKDTYSLIDLGNDQDFIDDDVAGEGFLLPWQNLANRDGENDEDIDDVDADDLINWDDYVKANVRRYKKAPNTFYGVRGKKYTSIVGVNPSGDSRRWNQFLHKLDEDRMRDMIMDNVLDRILENNNGDNDNDEAAQNDITKRAPTGFTGVRGKRPALSLNTDIDGGIESTAGKRGLGHAFVGVRGKKDVSHQNFKRSPLGGSGSSALGGVGGKRQRFTDFGNKFVAVRGKKSPYIGGGQWLANDWAAYDDNNMRKLYTPTSADLGLGDGTDASTHYVYNSNAKRAPSGFQGMRGKRPNAAADDLLTVN